MKERICIALLITSILAMVFYLIYTPKVLRTEEDLFRAIEKKDLGVTVDDFRDIDVEDFLFWCKTTYHEIRIDSDVAYLLGRYKSDLPTWEREKLHDQYLVRELKYVESTDEEFAEFLGRYFELLQMEPEFEYHYDDNGVIWCQVIIREESKSKHYKGPVERRFNFRQTSKSRELPISRKKKGKPYTYRFGSIWGLHTYTLIYYSKSGKYLMYHDREPDSSNEDTFYRELSIIETFCEMDD